MGEEPTGRPSLHEPAATPFLRPTRTARAIASTQAMLKAADLYSQGTIPLRSLLEAAGADLRRALCLPSCLPVRVSGPARLCYYTVHVLQEGQQGPG